MQIREHAEAHPSKPAVIIHPSGTTVTFGELEARANRLAHFFRRNGLREGDTVAILMENNEHFHAVMWAARRSGLYYVPINTHLTAAEAAYIIDNSSAKAIVGSAALRKSLEGLADRAAERSAGPADHRRRRSRRLAALPRMCCGRTRYADRRRNRGRSAAVLVGHHGPPEGHQARIAAPTARRGAGHDVGAGGLLARPRGDLSQPRPALSHRPVGVVDDDSGRRASRRW